RRTSRRHAIRPGGLEPPTCGFSDPPIARRAGPSLRPHVAPVDPTAAACGRRALRRARAKPVRAYAGVSPGRLTRWSLHLPSAAQRAVASRTPPTARLGIARACAGFPEFTRFASTRRRAGPLLLRARRVSTRAPLKETAALSC